MHKVKKMKKKAFTLMELLVVIAIIALLMSIMMPSLTKVKQLAQITICRAGLKNHCLASMAYSSSNLDKLPVSYWQSWPKRNLDNAWRSYVMKETDDAYDRPNMEMYGTEVYGLGLLWKYKYLDNPEIFYCPTTPAASQEVLLERYRNFHRNDLLKYKRIDAVYSYFPLKKEPSRLPGGTIDVWPNATMSQHLTASSAFGLDKIRSWDHFTHFRGSKTKGQPLVNVCFGDGHVVVSDNKEFFTKERIDELTSLPSGIPYAEYAIITNDVLYDFLDTVEP